MATTYNIWKAVVSSGSLLYGPRFAFALWACQFFGDRPLLQRLKLLCSLLQSQTASKLPTAVHQDQGALHDVVQLAGIAKELSSFHLPEGKVLTRKISPVKFLPLATKGEKGENFPPAKISRYTVYFTFS